MTLRTYTKLDSSGMVVVCRQQDVEPILDANKEDSKVRQQSEWYRLQSRIPAVVLEEWLKQEWDRGNTDLKWSSKEFTGIIQKKLRDPEWKYLLVKDPSPKYVHGAALDRMA